MQTAEQNYLQARKEARTGQDSQEQPAPVEAVDVLEDSAPIEDVIETEAAANEEVTTEIEESEAQTVETQNEETDLFYYDIDGEEVSSDQIKSWKNGSLMQDDYTRKSQVNAKIADDLDVRDQTLTKDQSKLSEQLSQLEAMIAVDELSTEALDELWEYDPDKWKEHTTKQDARKKFIKENKVDLAPKSNVNTQDEQAKVIAANPQWVSGGKATDAYQKDMNSLDKYYAENNFTQVQVDAVNSNHLIAQAVLEAARAKSLGKTNAAIEKRVRKAPVSTKPRAQARTSLQDEIKKVQTRFNQSGSDKDFLALRKLKRQLKN